MNIWRRLMNSFAAGREAWQQYDDRPGFTAMDRYDERWSMFIGSAFSDPLRSVSRRAYPGIYQHTLQMWSHVQAIARFYEALVYRGDLPTDGERLPDGTLGAIPIDPRIGDETKEQQLRLGIAACWQMWNWQQHMTQRPLFASILGDCMTELIDDVDHAKVYPSIVWPGYVKEIELDPLGNLKYYALEYLITEELEGGRTETYQFRKEVDGKEFRYFRNGHPYDQYGQGAVVPNPYGFVPAVWDRHKIGFDERGISALDGTRVAVAHLNSLLSHAIDYQHKQFYAPILIKGQVFRPGQTQVKLSQPPRDAGGDNTSWYARVIDMLPAGSDADIVQAEFDLGQTDTMIERLEQRVLAENPEASYYHELRQMSEVSGPGAERALGDATSAVMLARANYDIGTIKLHQMALAIGGMRIKDGSWLTAPGGSRRQLSRRQEGFRPFDLDSYARGDLDFGIMSRPVLPETDSERLDLVLRKEQIQTTWGWSQFGIDEETAKAIIDERNANSVIGAF